MNIRENLENKIEQTLSDIISDDNELGDALYALDYIYDDVFDSDFMADDESNCNSYHCLDDEINSAYERVQGCIFRHYACYCAKCGTPLKTYYAENRLYVVKCEKCETLTLVKAPNPYKAESKVGIISKKEVMSK